MEFAETASWLGNIALFIVKAIAVYISGSKSVWASLADSGVDLVSQAVLSYASYKAKQAQDELDDYEKVAANQVDDNPKKTLEYPLGRVKTEPLGVLACGGIMIFSCVEIVQFSSLDLFNGMVYHVYPTLDVNAVVYGILASAIGLKFALWLYCLWANLAIESDILGALAEDHFNDVFSNIGGNLCYLLFIFVNFSSQCCGMSSSSSSLKSKH